jgi:hypothetical protein
MDLRDSDPDLIMAAFLRPIHEERGMSNTIDIRPDAKKLGAIFAKAWEQVDAKALMAALVHESATELVAELHPLRLAMHAAAGVGVEAVGRDAIRELTDREVLGNRAALLDVLETVRARVRASDASDKGEIDRLINDGEKRVRQVNPGPRMRVHGLDMGVIAALEGEPRGIEIRQDIRGGDAGKIQREFLKQAQARSSESKLPRIDVGDVRGEELDALAWVLNYKREGRGDENLQRVLHARQSDGETMHTMVRECLTALRWKTSECERWQCPHSGRKLLMLRAVISEYRIDLNRRGESALPMEHQQLLRDNGWKQARSVWFHPPTARQCNDEQVARDVLPKLRGASEPVIPL